MTHNNRVIVDSVIPSLPAPVVYTPEYIGFKNAGTNGEGVSICIIDSGVPSNDAITSIHGSVNFTSSEHSKDVVGHSTIVSGFIGANQPGQIIGLAPNASLYFAKMVDDSARVRFDAFVAAVLWGIIKDVDIICIPMTTDINNPALADAIKKALDNNICIVASAGNHQRIDFPAQYDGVISVGALDVDGNQSVFSAKGDINVRGSKLASTYMDQSFAIMSGTSASTGLVTGMCARIIESFKKSDTDYSPDTILHTLRQLQQNSA